jgi:hypothetical protein
LARGDRSATRNASSSACSSSAARTSVPAPVSSSSRVLRTPLTLERALLEETLTDRQPTVEAFRATFERILTPLSDRGSPRGPA